MFMLKSTRIKILDVVLIMIDNKIVRHLAQYHSPMSQPVKEKKYICEICGCYIAPGFAVAGKKEIREKVDIGRVVFEKTRIYDSLTDYIYTPFYCKVHAPKIEEKPKGQ
jgi:hypothetical protein